MKSVNRIFSIVLLFILVSCAPDTENEPTVTEIYSMFGTIVQTDMDYPYLYISANTDGFFRLDLSSDDFTAVNLGLLDPEKQITQARYIDADDNEVIALTDRNIWHSTSYGMVWFKADNGVDRVYSPCALSRSTVKPQRICFINSGDAMYTSSDWGVSWQKGVSFNLAEFNETYWDPNRQWEIWINGINPTGKQFLRCFDNMGSEERTINIPSYNNDNWCSNVWFFANKIYMYTKDSASVALIRSADGGESWSDVNIDCLDSLNIDNIFYDPLSSGKLYLIDNDQKMLYSSTDMLATVNKVVALNQIHEQVRQLYYIPVMSSLILITESKIYQVELNS